MTKASGDKVKLPREVAEAIQAMFDRGRTPFEVVELSTRKQSYVGSGTWTAEALQLRKYAEIHFYDFLLAIVNGYEVEQTPKEVIHNLLSAADRLEDYGKDELEGLMVDCDTSIRYLNDIKREVLRHISFRPSREKE